MSRHHHHLCWPKDEHVKDMKRKKCIRVHCWPQFFSPICRQTLALVSSWLEWIFLSLDFGLGHVTCFGEWYLVGSASVTILSLGLNRSCMLPHVLPHFYHHHEMNTKCSLQQTAGGVFTMGLSHPPAALRSAAASQGILHFHMSWNKAILPDLFLLAGKGCTSP